MRFFTTPSPILIILFLICPAHGDDWAQAAGPAGNFIAKGKAPSRFSVARDENVRWRIPLPNTGQGGVVVSGGRVFVASHAPTKGDAETGSLIIGQCFDASTGKELWSKQWVPFGRHHSRQHEPILHDGKVIVVRVKPSDLDPKVTTKGGAKPLGRDRAYWTWLHAYDVKTGDLIWTGESGTSIHATPLLCHRADGDAAILTARGGGHQPPEEPYGISLLNALDGKTIWDLELKGYASHQNCCSNSEISALFSGKSHHTIDLKTGKIRQTTSLSEGVQICHHVDGKYLTESDQNLKASKKPITYQTNILVGNYHYFRAFNSFHIGRVHLYVPTMVGTVYILKWNAPILNESALVSISDLGPAGKTWTLSSLSYSDGRIYARTMKELICIGNRE